jgi:signal peptidase I
MSEEHNLPGKSQPAPEGSPGKHLLNWKEYLIDFGKMLLIALVLYFLVDSVIARVEVQNISMYPTLKEGEILLVNKLAYKLGKIERGDILTFHYPLDPSIDFIKREIGLPGDVVEVKDAQVWVNNVLLHEPYLVTSTNYSGKWIVPDDSIFVLGDNRNDSADSHIWGFVPLRDVVGKALVIYWPLSNFRILDHINIMQQGFLP